MNARLAVAPLCFVVLSIALAGCPKKPAADVPVQTPIAAATEKPAATPKGSVTPTLVALSEPENPVVAFRFAFRTGSADDPPGKEGLANLTALVMVEGGTKKLSSVELVRALYPMAADLDATVDREMTVFTGRCHKDHVAMFLPLLLDVLLEPRLDTKEFERLKDDVTNDLTLRLRTSDDENLGKELLETMLGAGHGYGHPPLGTESGLSSITLDDVAAFRKKAFGRSRLIIGIGGGYEPGTPAELQQKLAALPAGDPPATHGAVPVAAERNALIVTKPMKSTAVSMGFNIDVKRGDPDFFELRMAMGWFGEHRQSVGRLFQVIREQRGFNYGDYAYIEEFVEHPGTVFAANNIPRRHQHFEIWLRPIEAKNAAFATRAALWQFDQLITKGLTEEEFREYRDWLTGYSRLWELTTDRRLGYAIDDVWYNTPGHLDAFRKAMAKMSAAQVNEALKRRLSGRALQIAVATQDGDGFKDALVSGKPTYPDYGESKPPAEITDEDPAIAAWPFGIDASRVKVMPVEEAFK